MNEPLVLGRYRVVRRLAQGGMGVVYLGRLEGAAGFSKPVIIKRILPDLDDREDNTARFIREAQILSQLQHPGIVGVLDFGREESGYAMVLEYMHGYDLGRWLKYLELTATPMPWEEAVLIILRALDGLHYAHTFRRSDGTPAGVLHRDVSPGNILLDLDAQVRLLDFGIARMLQGDAGQYKTRDGVLSGKLSYLAPELFSAAASSVASDIYACGLVLYLMLTGIHPFSGESESHTMWRVFNEMPPPVSSVRSDVPRALEAMVFQSFAKNPEHRHASAEQFARELRSLLTRNEAAILGDLRQRVRRDFTGEMPALLRLEPLTEREQCWRRSLSPDEVNLAPLRSSHLPPAPRLAPASVVGRVSSATASEPMPAESRQALLTNVARDVTSGRRGGGLWKFGMALGIGLAVIGVGLASRRQNEPALNAGRLIVVQSPAPDAEAPLAAAAPAPDQRTGSAGLAMPGSASGTASDSSNIARQLARRQVALQACFLEFARDETARVQITLSVDVAASGQVTAAALEPSALEPTSAGQCLLRVAKETTFRGLHQSVHFSVPLRARAVSK